MNPVTGADSEADCRAYTLEMQRRFRKHALIVIVVAWALGILLFVLSSAHGLTPPERKLVERILQQAEIAKGANDALKHANAELASEAEQARIEAANANSVAMMAASSAFSTGVKAKSALEEAARCKKENEEMRPIVKAVTGPWWFPGGNALIYGAKKSLLSLVVIIVGGFVVFLIIKIAITLLTGGTLTAGFAAVGGIFGKLGRWFGRAGKRLLSFLQRRGKERIDNIKHRTIGTDDDL
jgi:hypothetical protein